MEVNSKKPFRPKKLPIYLGISVKDQIGSQKRFTELLKFVMGSIVESHSDKQAEADLTEFNTGEFKNWKWPGSHHITTYFVGKEKAKTTEPIYKSFAEGVNFPLKFKHILYVPGKIATAIVFVDRKMVQVENMFPHMTIAWNEFAPKQSNDVLNVIFGGHLKAKYESGLSLGANQHFKLNPEIEGKMEDVYLYELPEELYFSAEDRKSVV